MAKMCLGKDHVVSPIMDGAKCSCGKEWHWTNYTQAHNSVNQEKKPKPWREKPNFAE